MIYKIVIICLASMLVSCMQSKEVGTFNLRIDGIPVFYFHKIETVYRMEEGKFLLPVSNESYRNLHEFMGDIDSITLDLFIGESKLTEVRIFRLSEQALNDGNNSLMLHSNSNDIEKLLKNNGIKIRNH